MANNESLRVESSSSTRSVADLEKNDDDHPYNKQNILLMTDGYKFSHYKQFPVSWSDPAFKTKIFKEGVTKVYNILSAPSIEKIVGKRRVCFITENASCVQEVDITQNATTSLSSEYDPESKILNVNVTKLLKSQESDSDDRVAFNVRVDQLKDLNSNVAAAKDASDLWLEGLQDDDILTFTLRNVDSSKERPNSSMEPPGANQYTGGYNVSYFTPRSYDKPFSDLYDDITKSKQKKGEKEMTKEELKKAREKYQQIVFFGLRYFIETYVTKKITEDNVQTAADFVARYMSNVSVVCMKPGPTPCPAGYDFTMFPYGDWMSIVNGDWVENAGDREQAKGKLPVKIEALPEGTVVNNKALCFKITNTHPRFYWLPNFLETLLVQVWYPTAVATQCRIMRGMYNAFRVHFRLPRPENVLTPPFFHRVFDLLDFGYRGVSSHETAALGSMAYYTAGLQGSDTTAGMRMACKIYPADADFYFRNSYGGTSVPAAEHSCVTSWGKEKDSLEAPQRGAFYNMIRQYVDSFCFTLVSDGFNIWNAIPDVWGGLPRGYNNDRSSVEIKKETGLSWDTKLGPENPYLATYNLNQVSGNVKTFLETHYPLDTVRGLVMYRQLSGTLSIVRPDSGEVEECLPNLLHFMFLTFPEHCVVESTNVKGTPVKYVRFKGQQLRLLQGDGVSLREFSSFLCNTQTNGYAVSTVHYGSGGGLLQKVNRDSLGCAFKCCAMVAKRGDNTWHVEPISKMPIDAPSKESDSGDLVPQRTKEPEKPTDLPKNSFKNVNAAAKVNSFIEPTYSVPGGGEDVPTTKNPLQVVFHPNDALNGSKMDVSNQGSFLKVMNRATLRPDETESSVGAMDRGTINDKHWMNDEGPEGETPNPESYPIKPLVGKPTNGRTCPEYLNRNEQDDFFDPVRMMALHEDEHKRNGSVNALCLYIIKSSLGVDWKNTTSEEWSSIDDKVNVVIKRWVDRFYDIIEIVDPDVQKVWKSMMNSITGLGLKFGDGRPDSISFGAGSALEKTLGKVKARVAKFANDQNLKPEDYAKNVLLVIDGKDPTQPDVKRDMQRTELLGETSTAESAMAKALGSLTGSNRPPLQRQGSRRDLVAAPSEETTAAGSLPMTQASGSTSSQASGSTLSGGGTGYPYASSSLVAENMAAQIRARLGRR